MSAPSTHLAKKPIKPPHHFKKDFPLLQSRHDGKPLHYLDNAATTQKPATVIEAVRDCYRQTYAPIHRGLYPLAEIATQQYENGRAAVARFIGAPFPRQLIFTRSATEAINMVAWGWARPRLSTGDAVWVTRMEHHANLLPWQRICRERGADLRFIEINEDGTLDVDGAAGLFDPKTRIISLCHVSNVLGTENPLEALCARARDAGIPVLIDAAQSAGHRPVDVSRLDCDFLAFSAHKMVGPSGIGALYGSMKRLEEMEPLLVGGGMVDQVDDTNATWAKIPERFEAGSPNVAGAAGFAAAAAYLSTIGMSHIQTHVSALTEKAAARLSQFPRLRLFPPHPARRTSILSFDIEGIHPHDVAQVAGEHGVALRAGHHCCQPLMKTLGISGTVRASFGLYNTDADIEALCAAIDDALRLFG